MNPDECSALYADDESIRRCKHHFTVIRCHLYCVGDFALVACCCCSQKRCWKLSLSYIACISLYFSIMICERSSCRHSSRSIPFIDKFSLPAGKLLLGSFCTRFPFCFCFFLGTIQKVGICIPFVGSGSFISFH